MFEDDRVFTVDVFRGAKQIGQGLIKFALPKLNPAKAVQVRAVVGFDLQRAPDRLLGFIQVHVVIGPHVAQVIIGFRRVGGIECD